MDVLDTLYNFLEGNQINFLSTCRFCFTFHHGGVGWTAIMDLWRCCGLNSFEASSKSCEINSTHTEPYLIET